MPHPDPLQKLADDVRAYKPTVPDEGACEAAARNEQGTREANPNTIAKASTGLYYLRGYQLGSLARRKMMEG